jgi:hypothetical protein
VLTEINTVRVIMSRRIRLVGYVALMGWNRNSYKISMGKPEGERPLGRPIRGWEDNIKMDL